jgi:hypothetical protein
MMRSPSARCWPHEVALTRNVWGQDADGGRTVSSTTTSSQVDCSVQPGDPERLVTIDPETGLRRITQISPCKIIFPENPKLSVDDLVTYVDDDRQTHVYQVKGTLPAAFVGSVWEVRTVEVL